MLDRFTGDEQGKARMAAHVPLKRVGNPDEVAAAVVFLALGTSSFVTGHSLSVDGGVGAD
jgi:NAD(P)-dependent dehydrogenase (short-subunit alcohol dehydrogenase family)